MKRSFNLILVLFLIIPSAFAQHDQKALDILNTMSKKYQSIPAFKANFKYVLENDQENINEDFTGEITVKGDKFKLDLGGQEIINNGKTVWTYLPDANEVNIDNYDPNTGDMTLSKILTAYKKGYKYVFLEERSEAGTTYEVVDLIPEDRSVQFHKIRMEISKKDKTLKKWTIHDKTGTKYLYTITAFDPNVKVTDSFFEFDKSKHKGVEVIDLR